MSDFLNDRRRGAEEGFFAKQNEVLRANLGKAAGADAKEDLAAASGIADDAVLDALLRHEVGREGAAALGLVPLVAVAWADGDLGKNEEAAILQAAERAGLTKDSASYRLLAGWLTDEPPASLVARWRDYARELTAAMDAPTRAAFRTDILGRARLIAEASGGFLGIGKVSSAEQAVLADLERALA